MTISLELSVQRSSRLVVEPGLYVLRYVKRAGSSAPAASLSPFAGSEGAVSIINAPGLERGHLAGPGSALVILAHTNADLELTINGRFDASNVDATFQLEQLSDISALGRNKGQGDNANRGGSPLRLLAHVAYRGDLEVGEGEWAAGPRAPSPIEGLEIRSGISDVEIETQVLIGGQWSERAPGGVFLGSRGRSRPIGGIRLRVVGVSASRHLLEAEALFLGSAIQGKRGQELELVAPSGTSPLVGLRVRLVWNEPNTAARNPAKNTPTNPRKRVFRTSP